MDRSALNRNFLTRAENRCREPNKDRHTSNNNNLNNGKEASFEETFGMPYTYMNCLAKGQHLVHPNCSVGILKGKRNGIFKFGKISCQFLPPVACTIKIF